MKNKSIHPCDCQFLQRLSYIALMPKMLYYYGNFPEPINGDRSIRFPGEVGRPKTVAIVGSRKYTSYGENYAYKISYELAKLGVIIVSGLAYGIDSIAHRAALDAGGKTVAILGTAIDRIYPAPHRPLAEEIVKKDGAVMSEYAPGERTDARYSFLDRNRLIAGLADIVVVIEADYKSGSLNTAAHALENGVPVFALPGDVDRQMSRGCNGLFNKGAAAITSIEDIVTILFDGKSKNHKSELKQDGDSEIETMVIRAISRGIRDGEKIVEYMNSDDNPERIEYKISEPFLVRDFNVCITMLELKNRVRRLYGNEWMLA